LGASDRHQVAEIILVANDEGAESDVVRHHAGQILHGTEQEIRLPLGLGKRVKEGKDVRVLGDSERELLVQRRDTSHLSIGEPSVPVGRIHLSTPTYFTVPHISEDVGSISKPDGSRSDR
jgi:hypothetical protein